MAHLFLQKTHGVGIGYKKNSWGKHSLGLPGARVYGTQELYTTTRITSSMHSGCVNSLSEALSLLEMLMRLLLKMLFRQTWPGTRSATFLQALERGRTFYVEPAGQMTGGSGQGVALVSQLGHLF